MITQECDDGDRRVRHLRTPADTPCQGRPVAIDWDDYQRLPPELLVRPRDISREEAWRRHRLRMRLLPERLAYLERWAALDGVVVGERGSRDRDALEDWVHDVVFSRFPVDGVPSHLHALESE